MLQAHRRTVSRCVFAAAVIAVGIGGCRKTTSSQDREVDYSLIRIDMDHLNLRHDRVGHDQWESDTTFALVDAHNDHDRDLLVTLGGELIDQSGAKVGTIRTESLRIPAGGVRTFAMIDDRNALRRTATSARVRVMGAYVPNYPPPLQVTDGNVYKDGDRVVANAMIRNTAERPAHVIVIGGFYDRDGTPVRRPFKSLYILGDADMPIHFVGPPGSVKAYIFVGDMVY